MNGKATCAILKQIRRDIAEKNDIALTIEECTYQGNCSGTCPRCEAEVRILERALAEKKKRGIKTAVAGISAGILAAGLISCTPVGAENGVQNSGASGGAVGTQITETDENGTEEVFVTDGELVPSDFTEDGDNEEWTVAGKLVPEEYSNPGDDEEYPLEGEPPVTDYCPEDAEEATAGILPAEEYELEGDVLAPEFEEEQP